MKALRVSFYLSPLVLIALGCFFNREIPVSIEASQFSSQVPKVVLWNQVLDLKQTLEKQGSSEDLIKQCDLYLGELERPGDLERKTESDLIAFVGRHTPRKFGEH